MKILIVHNSYASEGGEDVVFEREKNNLCKQLGKENVFEYRVSINQSSKAAVLFSIFYSRKHYQGIYQLVKSNQIDIVHIHNYFPVLTASVFKAAKDAGASVVHTVHNYRWWCIAGNFYRDNAGICTLCVQKNAFLKGVFHRCYRNSFLQSSIAQLAFNFYKWMNVFQYIDQFWVLTVFQKEKLIQLGLDPAKLQLKPNIVNQPFTQLVSPLKNKKGFLFIGRMDQSKGIEFLLNEWKKLPQEFKLTIVGSGHLEAQMKQQYQQANIVFMGALPFDQVSTYIQQAKFVIQSSLLFETMGLTIIESMSFGTPVIGFNIGTRPELIEHGKTGLICSPDNFINTIQLAAAYPDADYESMVSNSYDYAKQFVPERIMAQQLHLYQNLLSK